MRWKKQQLQPIRWITKKSCSSCFVLQTFHNSFFMTFSNSIQRFLLLLCLIFVFIYGDANCLEDLKLENLEFKITTAPKHIIKRVTNHTSLDFISQKEKILIIIDLHAKVK
jgi:hypothetical protein